MIMNIKPGTYRTHLSGEASYRSFIPLPLQQAVQYKTEEDVFWYESAEIQEAAERVSDWMNSFNDLWIKMNPDFRNKREKELAAREAEYSVLMAYPRQPSVQPVFFPMPDGENPAEFGSISLPELTFFSSGTEEKSFRKGQPDAADCSVSVPSCSSPFISESQINLTPADGEKASLSDGTDVLISCFDENPLEQIPEDLKAMAETDIDHLIYAQQQSSEFLRSLPLSGRLLQDLHYIVLRAEHYDKMYRGEFRRSPVWIGQNGRDLRSAEFIPPAEEQMTEAFSDLEKFLHYEESVSPLVKAALIHYQFETIHPFIDGNGRMGRLMTLLYLKESGMIRCPWIQLSAALFRGMDRYYKEIRTVQLSGDYHHWTLWFLNCLRDSLIQTMSVLKE